MQSFPIDQLSRFYHDFKFSEDVEAIIAPTTLSILTGQRVSYGEKYFSMQYAAKNLRSLAERHHKTCKSLTENIVLVRKDGLLVE